MSETGSNSIRSSGRMEHIDIARGICMISIILGHLGDKYLDHFVFTYHIPVFYLIAGFFLRADRPFKGFITRRIKTLLIPYYVTSAITVVSYLIIQNFILGTPKLQIAEGLKKLGTAILYAAGDKWEKPYEIPGMGAIWFLWAMFLGQLIVYLLLKARPALRTAVLVLLFIFADKTVVNIMFLPLSVQPACSAALFIYFGYLFREIMPYVMKLSREVKIMGVVIMAWVWFSFVKDFKAFWLVHSNYGRGVVDLVGSICASAIVILFSYLLARKGIPILNRYLAFIGRYSLIFLCAHFVELKTFPWKKITADILGDAATDLKTVYLKMILKIVFASVITLIFVLLKKTLTRSRKEVQHG